MSVSTQLIGNPPAVRTVSSPVIAVFHPALLTTRDQAMATAIILVAALHPSSTTSPLVLHRTRLSVDMPIWLAVQVPYPLCKKTFNVAPVSTVAMSKVYLFITEVTRRTEV